MNNHIHRFVDIEVDKVEDNKKLIGRKRVKIRSNED